jgi:hypothetical protein
MTEERDTSALDAVLAATKEAAAKAAEANGGAAGRSKKPQSKELVDLATEVAEELWHDEAGASWVTFPSRGHTEHRRVNSDPARLWLRGLYYQRTQNVPGSQALQDAIGVLEAIGYYEGPEHPVCLRVAEHDDRVYVDLSDRDWNAVEVRPGSWQVSNPCPVRFRRARGMAALPLPDPNGDLAELRRFVNVTSEADWRLLVAWLLFAWRADRPYPALVLRGEQGSAKSTTGRFLRALIDPNISPLRAEPREVRDLMISATNSWCIALDNISYLPNWLSDAFCRLATGGGFSTRELWSDGEEKLFDVIRPALLTGITDVVTNPDLLDRVVTIDLPRIPEERRLTERQLWAEFNEARPRILGGLFHALSRVLTELPVTLGRAPRMADFAENSVATERAMGWPAGSFLNAYHHTRASERETALDGSLIAHLIRKRTDEGGFVGSASDLLAWLNQHVDERTQRQRRWPKQPQHLSGQLRRLMPDLRAAGWAEVEFPAHHGHARQVVIRKVRKSSPSPTPNGLLRDANDDQQVVHESPSSEVDEDGWEPIA